MELLTAADNALVAVERKTSVASALVPAGLVFQSEALLTGLRAMEVVMQLKKLQDSRQNLPVSFVFPQEISLAPRAETRQLAIEYKEDIHNSQQISNKGRIINITSCHFTAPPHH